MKYTIDPGRRTTPIMFIDNLVYSHVHDLEDHPLDLTVSITAAMGNSELAALRGLKVPKEELQKIKPHPVMIWFNGAGWHGADKNMQLPCFTYLAEAGFAVVCCYYRSSSQGHFPDQIIDARTAVRWVRANAEKYHFDPDHIGVFGRSAGGQLAALVGTNDGRYISEEYSEYSSDVQFVIDMFGPVDLRKMAEEHLEAFARGEKNPFGWTSWQQTHEGMVLGGPEETLLERAQQFSPTWNISDHQAPILIMHGDADPLVELSMSADYYERLCEHGYEDQTDFYVLKHAGHGTPEFFQEETRAIMLKHARKYLMPGKERL